MRARRLVFGALTALVAVGMCMTLTLGIFYLRARWAPFPRSDARVEGDFMFEPDDEIGFVAVRNGKSVRRHLKSGLRYHIFTDDRGARVDAPALHSPSRVDLLTIGCSFSWGHGVENEETFTEGLRRRTGLTVANFALAGYGTVHSLLRLRRQRDLRPRVIVYAFIDDHLVRNLSPCAPSYTPFCAPVARVALDASGAPAIRPPQRELFSMEQNRRFYEEITMTDGFSFRDVLWRARIDLLRIRQTRSIAFANDEATQATALGWLLGQLAEEARRGGASLLVVYLPALNRGEAGPPPKAFLDAVRAQGTTVLDLTPRVRRHYAAPDSPSLILAGDGHPNPIAHALIAEEVERELRARKILE